MSKEGQISISLILADGYSYTELIPFPATPDGTPGAGFIRIFHTFFSPNDEHTPETEALHLPLTPLNSPDGTAT
ncbi:hypothetical protein [Pseudomonas sp.]|uniref:hypothetical protein n=1 Tax=Pseudomonas sp. TaxID=306 RepID=UPI003D0B219A